MEIFHMTVKRVINVDPVHKKDKQIVNNYFSLSLLPICSKVLDKLAFDAIFEFIIENNFLNSTQPVFKSMFVLINLFKKTHSIFSVFDDNPPLEVCGVFLDL